MTIRPMFDMLEATRLTREGRLIEAMEVLRGVGAKTDATADRAQPMSTMPKRAKGIRALRFCSTWYRRPRAPGAPGRYRPSARVGPLLKTTI